MAVLNNYFARIVGALTLIQLAFVLCQSLDDKQDICQDKKISLIRKAFMSGRKKILLISLDDLRRTSAEHCPEDARRAFNDLVALAKEHEICSMDHAKRIEQYIRTHLQDKSKLKQLPEELVAFAFAYGLEVGNDCREFVVDHFSWKFGGKYTANLMEWTANNDHLISKLLPQDINNGVRKHNLPPITPSHFFGIFNKFSGRKKLLLRVSNSENLSGLQATCERHARPIYLPVVAPLARLIDLNLIYHTTSHSDRVRYYDPKAKESYWFSLVFLCESLRQIKFEAPRDDLAWIDIVEGETQAGAGAGVEPTNISNSYRRLNKIIKSSDHHQESARKLAQLIASNGASLINLKWRYESSLDELRDMLFKHGDRLLNINSHIPPNWYPLTIINKLLEMAYQEAVQGGQVYGLKQLEQVMDELRKLLDVNDEKYFLKTISKMVEESNPLLRKFALTFELLLISTRVALVTIEGIRNFRVVAEEFE